MGPLCRQGDIIIRVCLVQALYKQGVYTLVDMHQDFYSRWLNKGCGEGFPQ